MLNVRFQSNLFCKINMHRQSFYVSQFILNFLSFLQWTQADQIWMISIVDEDKNMCSKRVQVRSVHIRVNLQQQFILYMRFC